MVTEPFVAAVQTLTSSQLVSAPGGGDPVTRIGGDVVIPHLVLWTWVDAAGEGSAGPGWEYKTEAAARRRFATEVAKAMDTAA